MRLTMPQIILLTHSSSVNYKRMKIRMKDEKDNPQSDIITADKVTIRGKTLDQLSSDELANYYSSDGWGAINFL